MLINFIGAPCSGKTTTAAMLFSSLKETGISCELSSEQARLYIARKKVQLKLSPKQFPTLTDKDQVKIMVQQLEVDEALVTSCGCDVLVISDSSPINSLLYMGTKTRTASEVQEYIRRSLKITSATFLAAPIVRRNGVADPNRIHSQAQSDLVQQQIPALLSSLPPFKVIDLCGSPAERLLAVQNYAFGLL